MNRIFLVIGLAIIFYQSFGQTCTISCGPTPCTVNWTNSPATCANGGTIIIPAGVTLNFNDNADTWTGLNIEVFGTLTISAPGKATINSNITVKSGGRLNISSKLELGTTSGCGYTISIESGGVVDIVGGASDRLTICGVEVARGVSGPGGGCNPYPTGPLPYCEPPGGFPGPVDIGQGGVLPIDLLYFNIKRVGGAIQLNWATSKEENFSHFIIEHAVNGVEFLGVGEVPGTGYNTESIIEYSFIHQLPKLGFNYYRLKAVDLDGTFEYFGPIGERFRGEQSLWIYPNPSAGDKVNYEVNFSPNETDRVQLYNQMGALVADVPAVVHPGSVYLQEPLKPGAYVLRYSTPTEVLSARFIVLK